MTGGGRTAVHTRTEVAAAVANSPRGSCALFDPATHCQWGCACGPLDCAPRVGRCCVVEAVQERRWSEYRGRLLSMVHVVETPPAETWMPPRLLRLVAAATPTPRSAAPGCRPSHSNHSSKCSASTHSPCCTHGRPPSSVSAPPVLSHVRTPPPPRIAHTAVPSVQSVADGHHLRACEWRHHRRRRGRHTYRATAMSSRRERARAHYRANGMTTATTHTTLLCQLAW